MKIPSFNEFASGNLRMHSRNRRSELTLCHRRNMGAHPQDIPGSQSISTPWAGETWVPIWCRGTFSDGSLSLLSAEILHDRFLSAHVEGVGSVRPIVRTFNDHYRLQKWQKWELQLNVFGVYLHGPVLAWSMDSGRGWRKEQKRAHRVGLALKAIIHLEYFDRIRTNRIPKEEAFFSARQSSTFVIKWP